MNKKIKSKNCKEGINMKKRSYEETQMIGREIESAIELGTQILGAFIIAAIFVIIKTLLGFR